MRTDQDSATDLSSALQLPVGAQPMYHLKIGAGSFLKTHLILALSAVRPTGGIATNASQIHKW
jgi:hypothetical protein